MTSWREQARHVDGVEIHWREAGPRSGPAAGAGPVSSNLPTIVYVHGNTGCNLWFEPVMSVPGYTVLAPDLPNFGLSGHLDQADIGVYADYLQQFLRDMHVERCVLVGHSLGGAVAMRVAVDDPGLVAALVLIDSCPPGGLVTPEEHYPLIEQFRSDPALMQRALSGVCPALDDTSMLQRLTQRALRMNPIAFAGNARALARFSVEGQTGRFPGPVLVIHGSRDTIVTREMARETADAFPRGRLVPVEHVGHSITLEDPAEFLKILDRFLTSLNPGTADQENR